MAQPFSQVPSHGAIPVGKVQPAPTAVPYNAVAPAPSMAWDVLVVDGVPDGYVLVTQAAAAEGVAWVSPGSASLPSARRTWS